MPISKEKIRLIHVAKRQLGMEDADYRSLLMRVAGVKSSKDLDDFGFNLVMGAFAQLGFKSDFAKQHFGARIGMASPRQVALIRKLWGEYTDGQAGDAELRKWLKNHFKVDALQFLDPGTAHRAIGGLTNMVKRKKQKGGAAA